jgi:hypothetical protein
VVSVSNSGVGVQFGRFFRNRPNGTWNTSIQIGFGYLARQKKKEHGCLGNTGVDPLN